MFTITREDLMPNSMREIVLITSNNPLVSVVALLAAIEGHIVT